jgi:two-component system sensor histidine kinase TctE
MADAAHQMRTPLAALRAQAQLALDEDDPAEQRRSLATIERNASHMSRLLNQLLSDASAIHRAHLQQFETVDLAELLHQALYESIPQSGPRPDVRLAATQGPVLVRGDALLLREAIKNLIDNALKHGQPRPGREGGPLQIALTVAEGEGASSAVLTVADHGPGIAPADAQTVFERFARGHDAAAGGAGLGLAIVKRIVDSHGGRIDLSNRVGGGLIVTLSLPRLPA